jgi:cytochrome bd-type quinol oxidase subunit 2
MNIILLSWVLFFSISILLHSILIIRGTDNSINASINESKIDIFMNWLSGLLSFIGFILFIIWLTKYNNKQILYYMWILFLILTIILVSMSIFIVNNDDIQAISFLISGYTFIIFIGTLISYFVKKSSFKLT